MRSLRPGVRSSEIFKIDIIITSEPMVDKILMTNAAMIYVHVRVSFSGNALVVFSWQTYPQVVFFSVVYWLSVILLDCQIFQTG